MHHHIQQMMKKAVQNFQLGNFDDAANILAQVLKSQPKNFDALHILGIVKGSNNLHGEALEYFKKALRINPSDSYLHINIAKAFTEIGENDKALKFNLSATKLNPQNQEGWLGLGISFFNLNKFEEALDAYSEAIQLNPEYAEAWINKGNTLQQLNAFEEALFSFDQALQINPQIADAWYNRGNVLKNLNSFEQALISFDKALEINPQLADAWYNSGNAHQELKQYDQSIASYDKAIKIKPNFAQSWSNRGKVLDAICSYQLAEASYREAIRIDPENFIFRNNLLFNLNYHTSFSAESYLAEAKIFGSKVSAYSVPKFAKWDNCLDAKKIKIGFVSGDLSNHPVGYFLEGLLENLDPTLFELHAFSTKLSMDNLTNRIKSLFKEWSPIHEMSDPDAAALIHQKGIHVLIDLSGHTANNRLPVFSFKPAPVQASWLGLPSTTGVPEIDFVIGDGYALPIDYESQFTEKIWRLPDSYICLKPPEMSVNRSVMPAAENGFIAFGSFNNFSKMNEVVLETWSRILTSIPNSKLFLKNKQLSNSAVRKQLYEYFSNNKIEEKRLIFMGDIEFHQNHLEEYKKVDIALDTFPYPGVTTSFEAIYMGVPVLNLKGNSFLSSTATSISINAGLQDWVSSTLDEYVNKAVYYSSNLDQLSMIKTSLNQRVLKLPLFDTSSFSKNFGDALLGMWTLHLEAC